MKLDAATFEHPGVPNGHALRTHCNYRLSRESWLAEAAAQSAGICRLLKAMES